MHINHELHSAITNLPEGLENVYGEGEKPEWMATEEAIQAANEYCLKTGATPGMVWGGHVNLQLGPEPKLYVDQFEGLFPFAKLEPRNSSWKFPRVNCPSFTKVRIPNPVDLRYADHIIDRSEDAEDCVLMGLYEGNGVNPKQLIVCTGGVWNDKIARDGNPAETNFRQRQRDEFGMDIDESSYRQVLLIKDGSKNHIIWLADYGTKRAEWVVESFGRSNDMFSHLVVIRNHPESIAKVGMEFEEKGYQFWKWAVPIAQRLHGQVA